MLTLSQAHIVLQHDICYLSLSLSFSDIGVSGAFILSVIGLYNFTGFPPNIHMFGVQVILLPILNLQFC